MVAGRLETGIWLTFFIKVKGDNERIGNTITRDHNFNINFNCSYRRTELLGLSFTPQGRRTSVERYVFDFVAYNSYKEY